jgi:hypothetical protein
MRPAPVPSLLGLDGLATIRFDMGMPRNGWVRVPATAPHHDASCDSAQHDGATPDWAESWLDEAQEARSDAKRHDGAFHRPEATAPDVDLRWPVL